MIVGIDEVGRGAWAGPLCVAAVGLGGTEIDGLTDSKKLSVKRRERLAHQIKQTAPLVGIGWVSAANIDAIGMSAALKLAAQRALSQLNDKLITQIIIDGTIRLVDDPRVSTMKQADLLVPSVSAASIVAKVARDHYMAAVSQAFAVYGFDRHVGYGTVAHQAALEAHGTTPLHRMSFAPMTSMQPVIVTKKPSDGALAEAAAAAYLTKRGYRILAQNWKTKWCEVDIIAHKGQTTYFVEVKYRRKDIWGDGLSAITPKKLRQMRFAAELWMTSHEHREVSLAAVAVSGPDYVVDELLLGVS